MKPKYFAKLILSILFLIFICEYLIYYIVLFQCSWPELNEKQAEEKIPLDTENKKIHVMFIADTHLLGPRKGHWFDKLRREWQMYRTFQTALMLNSPEIVFILGDVFDEGLWCSDSEFNAYVQRFHSMFHVPSNTKLYTVVGNHDIGFHYGISPYLQERFSRAFNSPSVRMLTISGNHFVLINSMAMEGDGCFLCRPAELQINKIIARLKCTKGIGKCPKGFSLKNYSRPILLQHFPLYRESDADCSEPDEAPEDEKKHKFRERWECLSKESTEMLLDGLQPRVVVTGHTHHGCHSYHPQSKTHEYTVPSFSWRNKDNPSFTLAVFSTNNYAISKCYMPQESTVIFIYGLGVMIIIIFMLLNYQRKFRPSIFLKTH